MECDLNWLISPTIPLVLLSLFAPPLLAQQSDLSISEASDVIQSEKPANASTGADAAAAWRKREQAAIQIGDAEARIEAQQQLIAVAKDGEERFKLREKVARGYEKSGQLIKAYLEADDMLKDTGIGPARRSQIAAVLAQTMAIAGELQRSERYIDAAREFARAASNEEIELIETEPVLAVMNTESVIAGRLGKHAKSLALSRESFELAQKLSNDATLSEQRRKAALFTQLDTVWALCLKLEFFGRRDEALAIALDQRRRLAALPESEYRLGLQANLEYVVARAQATYGDYEEALANVDSALEKYAADGRNVIDNNFALARLLRGKIYLALGRQRDIRAEVIALQHARRLNPALLGNTNEYQVQALAAIGSRDPDDGIVKTKEYVDLSMTWSGSDSSAYKTARAMQVLAETMDPTRTNVKALATDYLDEFSTSDTQIVDGSERGQILEAAALQRILERTIDLPAAHGIGFKAAEILRTDGSQSALLGGAAKMAAANPELRALVERERAAASGRSVVRREAMQSANKLKAAKTTTNDASALERLQAETAEKAKSLADSQRGIAELRREISKRFPRYQELVSPAIPSVAGLAKHLRSNEVYVNLFPGREAGYAFAIDSSGTLSAWRVHVTRAQTARMVRRWRAIFDAGQPPADGSANGGLDLAAGRSLYSAWIDPIVKKFGAGKTLVVATSGPLAAVPWAALPLPEAADNKGGVSWAIEQAAFVTMPSASSLVLTRSTAASKAPRPMIAFADPSFDGTVGSADTPAKLVRRGMAVPAEFRSATKFDYRQLTRLPETLDEVKLIAAAIGADPARIISGSQATRSRAIKEDLSAARVVVFATHGLALGDVPGFDSAGLALALEGSGFDDSVLTVEDVANLRLNADLVLLSACNTGLTSGVVGDTVSALARGFFVAGARSLMVTAWPVETESAKQLAVGTFQAMKRPNTSQADALAITQRAMIEGKYGERYRHPFYWAPYFLIGDGSVE
jgi:CHAT domain-containing protein